jgi:hypothetical protein
MDYTNISIYEFDFGSEWTRAKSLDTCELVRVSFFNLLVYGWVTHGRITLKIALVANNTFWLRCFIQKYKKFAQVRELLILLLN